MSGLSSGLLRLPSARGDVPDLGDLDEAADGAELWILTQAADGAELWSLAAAHTEASTCTKALDEVQKKAKRIAQFFAREASFKQVDFRKQPRVAGTRLGLWQVNEALLTQAFNNVDGVSTCVETPETTMTCPSTGAGARDHKFSD